MPTTHHKAPERKAQAISDIRRAVLYSPQVAHSLQCVLVERRLRAQARHHPGRLGKARPSVNWTLVEVTLKDAAWTCTMRCGLDLHHAHLNRYYRQTKLSARAVDVRRLSDQPWAEGVIRRSARSGPISQELPVRRRRFPRGTRRRYVLAPGNR